jgi:hypothetical protein
MPNLNTFFFPRREEKISMMRFGILKTRTERCQKHNVRKFTNKKNKKQG